MKRWSYATAIMLSLAGGTIMTGCIDNDEPYGIEQIRLATADFLKSKKAAVEAEAAAANAQVEIEKIKAETEKLRIEAEAAIKAAQAKILEAQANKEQAEADKIKAETDAYIAAQKAALDEMIALAEINVKQAQLKYDDALYQFEQTKIKNAEAASSKLYQAWDLAFQAYLGQLAEVNSLNEAYLYTQKEYAMAEIDLKYNKDDNTWTSNKYEAVQELTDRVAYLEKEIKMQNDEIAKKNEYIVDLQNVKDGDFYKLFEKYEGLQNQNNEAIAKAEVEKATLAVDNQALYDKRNELNNKLQAVNSEEIAIPAYTWTPDAKLAAIGLTEPIEIVPERVAYTLGNRSNYNQYYNEYNWQIQNLKHYILDANDQAWTAARINEMKRQLATTDAALAVAQKNWEMAKSVYNNGKDVDASKLPGQTAMKAAVDAYNAAGAASATLQEAVVDAQKKSDDAYKAYSEAYDTYWGNNEKDATSAQVAYNKANVTYNEAMDAAREANEADIAAAERTKAIAVESAENAILDAQKAYDNAWRKLYELENNTSSYPNLEEDIEAAREALTEAGETLSEAYETYGEAMTKAQEAYNEAVAKANLKRIDAETAAEKDYQKAWNAFQKDGGYDETKDPAWAPVQAAHDAWDNARDAVNEAQNAFENGKNKIWDAYNAMNEEIQNQLKVMDIENFGWPNNATVDYNQLQGYIYGWGDYEFPVAVSPVEYKNSEEVYSNAKYLLVFTSEIAYGSLTNSYWKNTDDGILPWYDPVDKAFLLDKDKITVETLNEYIKVFFSGLNEMNYYTYYDQFGLFGTASYLNNRITVAQAYIDNAGILTDATATLQTNLEALETSLTDALEAREDLQNQFNDVDKEITALQSAVDQKLRELRHWQTMYSLIISDITNVIAASENLQQGTDLNIAELLESMIKGANYDIASCNNQIEYLNKQLDKAKYQLGLYEENKDTVLPNPYTIALEVAEANLAAAQEKLAFLKAHADELQAKYEAASKQ